MNRRSTFMIEKFRHWKVDSDLNIRALLTHSYRLGRSYRMQKKYAEAEPIFKRALDIYDRHGLLAGPDSATARYELGELYRAQNKFADAEPLLQQSVLWEEKWDAEHPQFAESLDSLASLYRDQGRYAESELLYRRAIQVSEKALGTEHPDVAATLNNLGKLYRVQGRYAEAETYFARALHINERVLLEDHPAFIANLETYATLLRDTGRAAQADKLDARAKTIRDRVKQAQSASVIVEGQKDAAPKGMNLSRQTVPESAKQEFAALAEKGDPAAEYEMWLIEEESDLLAAIGWLVKSAKQGEPRAQNDLGTLYRIGKWIEMDPAKAITWYREAAKQDFAPAITNLGEMYLAGSGVSRSEAKARSWFEKAVALGDERARAHLNVGATAPLNRYEPSSDVTEGSHPPAR